MASSSDPQQQGNLKEEEAELLLQISDVDLHEVVWEARDPNDKSTLRQVRTPSVVKQELTVLSFELTAEQLRDTEASFGISPEQNTLKEGDDLVVLLIGDYKIPLHKGITVWRHSKASIEEILSGSDSSQVSSRSSSSSFGPVYTKERTTGMAGGFFPFLEALIDIPDLPVVLQFPSTTAPEALEALQFIFQNFSVLDETHVITALKGSSSLPQTSTSSAMVVGSGGAIEYNAQPQWGTGSQVAQAGQPQWVMPTDTSRGVVTTETDTTTGGKPPVGKRVAGKIGRFGGKIAGAIGVGAKVGASAIGSAGQYAVDHTKPREKDVQVPATVKSVVKKGRFVSKGAVKVSGVFSRAVVGATSVVATTAIGIVKKDGDGGERDPDAPLRKRDHALEIGSATAGAIIDILGQASDATRTLMTAGQESATKVTKHKYGDDAGETVHQAAGIAKDAAEAYGARKIFGRKAIAKVAAKEAVKTVGKELDQNKDQPAKQQ